MQRGQIAPPVCLIAKTLLNPFSKTSASHKHSFIRNAPLATRSIPRGS